MRDEMNKAQAELGRGIGAQMALTEEAEPGQPSLLNRLHRRRRELERELYRVNNSIQFVEKNATIVDAVEVVLASREKCDSPRPLGF